MTSRQTLTSNRAPRRSRPDRRGSPSSIAGARAGGSARGRAGSGSIEQRRAALSASSPADRPSRRRISSKPGGAVSRTAVWSVSWRGMIGVEVMEPDAPKQLLDSAERAVSQTRMAGKRLACELGRTVEALQQSARWPNSTFGGGSRLTAVRLPPRNVAWLGGLTRQRRALGHRLRKGSKCSKHEMLRARSGLPVRSRWAVRSGHEWVVVGIAA